nr:unnamed protein product [Rous sarcoma virus]
MAGPSIP